YTPGTPSGLFGTGITGQQLAVDNSGGPNDGDLFALAAVVGKDPVQVFSSTGEWLTQIGEQYGSGTDPRGVAVGPEGHLYTSNPSNNARIREFNTAFQEIGRIYLFNQLAFHLRVDSTGA